MATLQPSRQRGRVWRLSQCQPWLSGSPVRRSSGASVDAGRAARWSSIKASAVGLPFTTPWASSGKGPRKRARYPVWLTSQLARESVIAPCVSFQVLLFVDGCLDRPEMTVTARNAVRRLAADVRQHVPATKQEELGVDVGEVLASSQRCRGSQAQLLTGQLQENVGRQRDD
jgi:hypothetical protein